MKLQSAFLLIALSIAGCSDDDTTPATTADTGEGTDTGGPITTRPDDGVDTNVADTTVADTGTTPTDSSTPSDGATDSKGPDALPDVGVSLKIVTVGAGGTTFSPSTLTIKPGDTVRWVFSSTGHNVVSGTSCTADNKFCNPADMSCTMAPTAASGTSYEHTFPTAGSFPYFCAPHCGAGMTGTITVAP